ncbi:uncharacterized protein EV420DRAFT_1558143 [Desarmillaria tabescens]|uniref:DUF6534 domain-containing protein n=1 Tax=Armillaria tabescens TaxID=1929756 RepID=A0AA39K3E4_ARMTA|nr:uncharacterized protein EV420DRAFT_1558143 [Desarmillaria tabescens]KAK0452715.1 hypothetical protein EV420DRAFT_1558143 [Desarmillaria tabescens]
MKTLELFHFDEVSSGVVLAISWLNTSMYTSQVALSIYYLYRFVMTKWLRYWILASLVIDGACSIVVLVYTYELLVNNADPYELTAWTMPFVVLFTYASASITQAFFCYRYWTISRNKWIAGCIMFIITVNTLFALFIAIYFSLHPKDLLLALPLAVTVICAATDIVIASSLVWACWHIESPYATTRNILRRVMIQALACGFLTAISSTLMIVFLLVVLNVHYSFLVTLGRIYSLSVLLNLILLKGMHRNDPCTMWIDGSIDINGPAVLDSILFKNTSNAKTGNTQLSESSRPYPTRTLANDQFLSIHTV